MFGGGGVGLGTGEGIAEDEVVEFLVGGGCADGDGFLARERGCGDAFGIFDVEEIAQCVRHLALVVLRCYFQTGT